MASILKLDGSSSISSRTLIPNVLFDTSDIVDRDDVRDTRRANIDDDTDNIVILDKYISVR